jgi:predicted permease
MMELADRLMEEGWSEEGALEEARRRFGDPERYRYPMARMEKRRISMERRALWFDLFRQAFGSVARSCRRYPGFTLGVVLTLALGIGANATMYGILDRLLLQPPAHIEDHERVQRVFGQRPNFMTGEMTLGSTLTYPDYADLKAHGGLDVAAFTLGQEMTIGSGEEASRARVALATAEFFPLLGVIPAMGRFYSPDEAAPGSSLTAVVSEEYWERQLGGDPAVLGRTIEVAGRAHVIVGVAPRGFTGVGLEPVDLWVPLEATHDAENGENSCLDRRGCWWLSVVGRLRGDVTEEAAEAEATRLHLNGRRAMIEEERYSERAGIVLGSVIAARGPEASDETRVARWLAGVSVIVLLIACANVANLLMARGTRRRRETALRLSLGAGRRRVVVQTMLESLALAVAGGVVALVLAEWGGGIVRSALLPGVYFPGGAISGRLLGFTALATVVAAVVAGAVPAIHGSRGTLLGHLTEGDRASSQGRSRLRSFLTVFQAGLSVVLLFGAGLFVRSLNEVRSLDLGLEVDRLLLAGIELQNREVSPQEQTALYEEAIRRVETSPGVASAAATAVPFQWAYAISLKTPGLDSIPTLPGGGPYFYPVSPGYFETLGIAITRGRPIDASDAAEGAAVTVVSETMARTLWPDEDALGQCLLVGSDAEECTTVVGVAEDAARGSFRDEPFMAYYVPATQRPEMPYEGLYVRMGADADESAFLPGLTSLLRSFSPQVRFANVRRMEEILDPQARAWELGATMFSAFGLLALALAAIGLYSVLAFDVAQRTRELGIRMALGAEKRRLLRGVLLRGARLGLIGVILGLGVAYLAAPYLRDLLFQVSPSDPWVLAGVPAVLLVVSALASLIPGLKATTVDPMEALRAE